MEETVPDDRKRKGTVYVCFELTEKIKYNTMPLKTLWNDNLYNLQPKLLLLFGDELLYSRLTDCHQVQAKRVAHNSDCNIFKFKSNCTWNKLCAAFQRRQIQRGFLHWYFLSTATLSCMITLITVYLLSTSYLFIIPTCWQLPNNW